MSKNSGIVKIRFEFEKGSVEWEPNGYTGDGIGGSFHLPEGEDTYTAFVSTARGLDSAVSNASRALDSLSRAAQGQVQEAEDIVG